eukprot:6202975-Amphidinium_carterae.3
MQFESGLQLPVEWATVMTLQPKIGSAGATRPISLLSGILRVWGRARRQLASLWESQHRKPCHWSCTLRPCEHASWTHALLREASLARGEAAGTLLLDIRKAYENTHHSVLYKTAVQFEFPLRLVAAAVCVCMGGRDTWLGEA